MKITEFKLNRLNDYAAAKELEAKENPFINTPFGMSTEGSQVGTWEMVYKRIGLIRTSFGINFFGKDDMILITVPKTETGVQPLVNDQPFGWDGKINEDTAQMAVEWAFELLSKSETELFLKEHKPSVDFSYFDSEGPGEMTVKFNGEFWVIIG
jgi:hypothetical protein